MRLPLASASSGFTLRLQPTVRVSAEMVIGCSYERREDRAPEDGQALKRLQGSKYLQSRSAEAMAALRSVDGGAFFGTPCQCAGADHLLRQIWKREDFLLVELICHGVPTPFLW